jgi:hypothetical protein
MLFYYTPDFCTVYSYTWYACGPDQPVPTFIDLGLTNRDVDKETTFELCVNKDEEFPT